MSLSTDLTLGTREEAERRCQPYRTSRLVPIYFDRARPERASVDESRFDSRGDAIVLALSLPIGIALFGLAVYWHRRSA